MDTDDDDTSSPTVRVQDFWPPWPFNLLQEKMQQKWQHSNNNNDDDASPSSSTYPTSSTASSSTTTTVSKQQQRRRPRTVVSSAWTISQRSVRIAVRNFQELGSHVWYHLPPAAPPLLVAMLLARTPAAATTTTTTTTTLVRPLLHNPFCRQCALAGVSLAMLSWGHTQWYRQRRLTPLASWMMDRRSTAATVPPALPPPVQLLDAAAVAPHHSSSTSGWEDVLPPRWRKYWNGSSNEEEEENDDDVTTTKEEDATTDSNNNNNNNNWLQQWQRRRAYRHRERLHVRRQALYDELVAHQQRRGGSSRSTTTNGCAVITGASQGIGRAIAIELARWKVAPLLVLVARNGPALAAVAADIEACYGVPCAILVADLSQRDAAQRVYDTIRQQAGAQWPVDVRIYIYIVVVRVGPPIHLGSSMHTTHTSQLLLSLSPIHTHTHRFSSTMRG